MVPPHTSAGAARRTLPRMERTARGERCEKNSQSAAAATEQLQNIPHHLGQIAILAQQQVIQITEHQSGCQRIVHVFFLLSVARKWVK